MNSIMNSIEPIAIYDTRHFFESINDDFSADILEIKIIGELPVAFWDSTALRKLVFKKTLSFVSDYYRLGDEKMLLSIQTMGPYYVLITIKATEMKISTNQWAKLCTDDGILNIPKKFVQAHKGVIDFADLPDQNSSFIRIILPLYRMCMK